jgi:hypothetical protein
MFLVFTATIFVFCTVVLTEAWLRNTTNYYASSFWSPNVPELPFVAIAKKLYSIIKLLYHNHIQHYSN